LDIYRVQNPPSERGVVRLLSPLLCLQEQVVVQLRHKGTKLKLSIPSSVRSIRECELAGRWLIECVSEKPLAWKKLDRCVTDGLLSRRAYARQPVSLPADAILESGTPVPGVELYNVSQGGFCFRTVAPVPVGERVQLFIQEPDLEATLQGTVRWEQQFEGGFLVGCMSRGGKQTVEMQKILAHCEAIDTSNSAGEGPSESCRATQIMTRG
jgi:hypothetical protein